MNNFFRGILSGAGAMKFGGGKIHPSASAVFVEQKEVVSKQLVLNTEETKV